MPKDGCDPVKVRTEDLERALNRLAGTLRGIVAMANNEYVSQERRETLPSELQGLLRAAFAFVRGE